MIYSAVLEVKLDSSGMIPTCVSGASVPRIMSLDRAEGLRLSVCTSSVQREWQPGLALLFEKIMPYCLHKNHSNQARCSQNWKE